MQEIDIMLVDDHKLFREGLKLLLSGNPDIASIEEASDGLIFLEKLKIKQPHLAFVDIEMPEMDGITATRTAMQLYPDLKIVALSMYAEENYYRGMIEAGAKGFMLKNSSFEEVNRAITDVLNGQNYFSMEIMNEIIKNISRQPEIKETPDLTERELEILYHICKGLSNQEIADQLFISKRTVDKHRENLLFKTNSKNTASLVIFAIKNGLFEV